MKRRTFIKDISLLTAVAGLWPRLGYSAVPGGADPVYGPLDQLHLTDFCEEQDESPILFGNQQKSWLTTLRRLDYPADQEIVSLFEWQDGAWKEVEPVTPQPGQFEAVAAACALGGEPLVAWTEKRGNQWLIQAAIRENGKFQPAITISDPQRRSINPVVAAVGPQGFIVSWEDYAVGAFSIWLARFHEGRWSRPHRVTKEGMVCFEPALAVNRSGDVWLTCSSTNGPHRNILLLELDGEDLHCRQIIPIAVGGGLKDRVNINAHSAAAFDREDRLWISWENNRFTSRLEDSDNYTGDRCCAMVCYTNGKVHEQRENGRWLFQGKNDHLPTFYRDWSGNLFALTHCGGDFEGNPFYSFRISRLDGSAGWAKPVTLLATKQKGELLRPAILFADDSRSFWLAWKMEARKPPCDCHPEAASPGDEPGVVRRGMLQMQRFSAPAGLDGSGTLHFTEAVVEEHHAVTDFRPRISGRPRVPRAKVSYEGEIYTLLVGNLHEHTVHSDCWPAGTDGTLHDDYRYGLYSEGYDFAAITDHDSSMTEVYWRKSLRMAEFYDDPEHFVAIPAVEWTLSNGPSPVVRRGVGHRNVFFADVGEARKFIRNRDEVYSINSPETRDAEKLWGFIHRAKVDCVAIPHHPADVVHPCDWEVHDDVIEPVVEVFQCRGNAEYRGAPRMINLSRHQASRNDKTFVDHALREKKYRLGFVASGDHNSMGVGLACLWVKEVSRKGILEALRNRRCFATTGDKIVVDFRLNGVWSGGATRSDGVPRMTFNVTAVDDIAAIDILRNSRVVHTIQPAPGTKQYTGDWADTEFQDQSGAPYYYIRVSQKNDHLAWSSPIWV